jgi:hypothetical protein
MVSPSLDVYMFVVSKSGAAMAPAACTDSGSGAITTMDAMRATRRDREARLLDI